MGASNTHIKKNTIFGLQRMNPFLTCELYDYIQRQELFIYAIFHNRPIRIDAAHPPDFFENDNLTIFLEEKGKSYIYLELQTAMTHLVPNSFGPLDKSHSSHGRA